MATVNIRDAVLAAGLDATACAGIYAPYVRDTAVSFETVPPSVTEMAQRMSDAQRLHAWLVAEIGGTVIGYAYAHNFAARPSYRWSCETSVYLDVDHRRSGVGTALYSQLLQRMVARGYRTALAGVTLPNTASDALHRAIGFEPVGVYRNVGWKHGSWHDVAWYQKDLGPMTDPPGEPR